MKKTIFTILVMATVAVVINKSQTKAELTELEKANVEALADAKPVIPDGCRKKQNSVCNEWIVTPSGSGILSHNEFVNKTQILD